MRPDIGLSRPSFRSINHLNLRLERIRFNRRLSGTPIWLCERSARMSAFRHQKQAAAADLDLLPPDRARRRIEPNRTRVSEATLWTREFTVIGAGRDAAGISPAPVRSTTISVARGEARSAGSALHPPRAIERGEAVPVRRLPDVASSRLLDGDRSSSSVFFLAGQHRLRPLHGTSRAMRRHRPASSSPMST